MIRYDSEGSRTHAAAGRSLEPADAFTVARVCPRAARHCAGAATHPLPGGRVNLAPPAPEGRRPAERGTVSPSGMPIDGPRAPASGGEDSSSGDPLAHAPHCTP